jgi:hypothetical protein
MSLGNFLTIKNIKGLRNGVDELGVFLRRLGIGCAWGVILPLRTLRD